MTKTLHIAPVNKSIVVNVPQAKAFDVFTGGIDRWWPKSHNIGNAPIVTSYIEPRLGGRWYAKHEDGSETVTGIMRVWEPPSRIVFSWDINAQWKPDTTVGSEVEVNFIAEGPNTTRVELQHRNFERLGDAGQTMRDTVDSGMGWGELLRGLKDVAEAA